MVATLTYTIFTLGQTRLHQLHTAGGKYFVVGEVAMELFQENPTAFIQALRKTKYSKIVSDDPDVLHTVGQLNLPVESQLHGVGIALLPATSVCALLLDRRRLDLVQPFKLALLKLASQEAARLMAAGDYELALPVALDAVQQGQALFKPSPALQLFPLYLLAAQANLGLRRSKPCEDFLALASWLVLKEPGLTTNVMRSHLARLYGQLYAFQGLPHDAAHAFAEDVYYCSLEAGPEDVRSSLGYYNLGKVFQTLGEVRKSMACNDQVVSIWLMALAAVMLGVQPDGTPLSDQAPSQLPVGRLQMLEVVDMLKDIVKLRAETRGPNHTDVADVHFVMALALGYLERVAEANEELQQAAAIYPAEDEQHMHLLDLARQQVVEAT